MPVDNLGLDAGWQPRDILYAGCIYCTDSELFEASPTQFHVLKYTSYFVLITVRLQNQLFTVYALIPWHQWGRGRMSCEMNIYLNLSNGERWREKERKRERESSCCIVMSAIQNVIVISAHPLPAYIVHNVLYYLYTVQETLLLIR